MISPANETSACSAAAREAEGAATGRSLGFLSIPTDPDYTNLLNTFCANVGRGVATAEAHAQLHAQAQLQAPVPPPPSVDTGPRFATKAWNGVANVLCTS